MRASVIGATTPVFFDVTPLLEPAWTGIPVVCAELARAFDRRFQDALLFMARDRVLQRDVVLQALASRSGHRLHAVMADAHALADYAAIGLLEQSAAFYPSVKPHPASFACQFSVIHDLSTLIVPEFHSEANIRYHLDGLERDLATNTLTFCVSTATRDDLTTYLGVASDALRVVPNGCGWPADYPARYETTQAGRRPRPYIVVLGTLEARKNVGRVFAMIERHPHLLDLYDHVFIGSKATHAAQVDLPPAAQTDDRVVSLGFVSDFEKYALLRGAAMTLYPSLFEGFGLPILESLSVGTPCVASLTSSHREAGGDACVYFDPLSVDAMAEAILSVHAQSDSERRTLERRGRAHAASLTWDHTAAEMLRAMAPYLERV
jgi:glycosyltransferase involved in cell wall biosynthesis